MFNALPANIISNVLRIDAIKAYDDSMRQVDAICRKIANKLASVYRSDCQFRGLETSGGYSVNGLPVIVKEFGPKKGIEPMAKVLLIGGMHGDELSSVSIVFKWMNLLDQYHSGQFHWRVVPVMNPDGLLQRRSKRTNKNGVDLNRNFPTPNWQAESEKSWNKTLRNPRRYPGDKPLSEPETRWLAKYIAEFDPDVIVSVHAPFGVVDFDGPYQAPTHFGPLQLNLLGTYPGSLGNYAGVQKNIPVVTIELASSGRMPTQREIVLILRDLVAWMEANVTSRRERAQKG